MTEREADETTLQLWKNGTASSPGWETLHPADIADPQSVPWCTDDETFTPDQLGPLGCWARVVSRSATDEQRTQGPLAMSEAVGVIIVQLFGPLNEGTAKLAGLADDVRTVMKRKRVGDLRTLDAPSSKPASDGTWAMRIVTIERRYTYTS